MANFMNKQTMKKYKVNPINIKGFNKLTAGLLMCILLLVIAPFYTKLNITGIGGLALPYNIPQWMISSWIIAFSLLIIVQSKKLYIPKNYYYFIAFPLVVVVSGLLTDVGDPITWLFRLLYIIGGFLFLFSLFQFQLKQRAIDRVLLLFSIATGFHACIGLYQNIFPGEGFAWFLASHDGEPRGIFQQINVHASYLVTGMIVTLYLSSRPFLRNSSILLKASMILSFGLSNYIVIYSGSRIALLSLLIALVLVLFSRKKQLLLQKPMMIMLFLVFVATSFLGQEGFNRTLEKTVQLTESEYSSIRLSMYAIGSDLVKEEPLHGHGIGSFLRVWHVQAAEFYELHPDAAFAEYVGHPHNEILFWLIEGGIIAASGIILFIIGLTVALYQCGFQRGASYAAILLPVGFHAQVEMPFYTSSVHWFLWLFLVYILLRHQQRQVSITLSGSAVKLLQVLAVLFVVITSYFMYHTDRAQTDLYNYLYNKDVKPPYLQIAYRNLYFRSLADKVAMRSLLIESIKNDDYQIAATYLPWADRYLQIRPEPEIFGDVADLNDFMYQNKNEVACGLVRQGFRMYPSINVLKDGVESCSLNEASSD